MPRQNSSTPTYLYHTSGQARVYLDGRYFYLGEHGSPASYAKFYALLATYTANGNRMPSDAEIDVADAPITVRCLTAEFREHAKTKYANNKTQRGRFNNLCTLLDDEYADVPIDQFGPRKLAEIRELLVATKNKRGRNNTRRYINEQIRSIIKVFRFGVSREVVDPSIVVALDTLEPLAYGQTKARESDPVTPVDIESVRLTAKFLSPQIKAMVRIQAATGMRPSEVCVMRPIDIEKRPDGVWVYRPAKHKTAHRGKKKEVPLVGDAKRALKPFLNRPDEEFFFKPVEASEWHLQQRRENRKTPMNQGDRPGYSKSSRSGTRKPREYQERYNKDSYRRAIERAAKQAQTDHWHPYQLRHTAASVIREALGIEAAQAMLGHSRAAMTEHYAKQSLDRAIEAAKVAPKI
ncbi:site-specific tyrosine recombinase XerC [Stieleria neptunia]|uniref:Site-specific tyrosine recombinase XerC n=1 Tax=Stieleria neptunia TaxID=2527979 RepID=A0A518HQ18_9BACT|nr:site-specific integrase [Stieleria neptunia]QDV42938.1 site-specific tyrosine recombinase XerC [Stieleria neptunia]